MQVSSIDYAIILVYLISIAVIGKLSGGKQKTVKDYFIGSQEVPWWAISFSIVAAETSTLTFISIPGLAYLTNLNFLQLTFGYLIRRIIVAAFFLPAYYKGDLTTAYSYLENRFGKKTRSLASVTFLFTRTASDGVRLFATAIPLYLMLDISPIAAIIIIARSFSTKYVSIFSYSFLLMLKFNFKFSGQFFTWFPSLVLLMIAVELTGLSN